MVESAHSDKLAALRQRAEEVLQRQPQELQEIPPEDIQYLIHELRVHQIELETQNEELRRTQREMELARDEYLDLYDFAPVGYLTLSEAGLILQANLTATTMLGVDRARLCRQPLSRFILSEDQDIYNLHRRKLCQTQEPLVCEMRIVRKDGSQFWARIEVAVAQDSEGQALCRAIISDITERKRADMVLLESEARYRSLFEDTPIGLYSSTPDGQLLAANAALVEMLAYPDCESMLQVNVADLHVDPKGRARWQAAMQREDELVHDFEVRLRRLDGRAIWVRDTARAVRDDEGRILRYDGALQDITERKRVREDLQRERDLVARIMETSPVGIAVFDRQGRIIYANALVQELAGMGQDELAFHTSDSLPWTLFTPDGQPFPEGQKIEHLMMRTERPLYDARFQAEATDGRRLLLSASAAPLLGESGQADGVVVVLSDVTSRQEAEEQLKASLREKGVLLKEIHHRVKNNLQVVSSLLDMRALSIQSPEAIEALEDSRHRVRTMAFVHERLYQSEDLASVIAPEYLESLTGYLLAAYERSTGGIRLTLQVDDVYLDLDTAIAVGLIVNELVSNALKHAFPPAWEGEGEIGVKLGTLEDGRFQLQVADNGEGFPPDLDLEGAESLGLRLVNMLTQQLQGTLELDRRAGAIFRIAFPGSARPPTRR